MTTRNFLIIFLLLTISLNAQKEFPLYPSEIPNSKPSEIKEVILEKDGEFFGYKNVIEPSLTAYIPKSTKPTSAVIICPGGGYGMESYLLEGIKIAEAYQKNNIAAFILKYRLPDDAIMLDKSIGPLQDAQQAIKAIRLNAINWNVDPNKIGIMGFSAGGHLAATAGTHYSKSYISNKEEISLRPDFMILVYPLTSMKDNLTHKGSRENLLGNSPTKEQILLFSNELHVNKSTPPTWLTHTGDDSIVSVQHSIGFYEELIKNKIPAEMHLYPKGNHGFVLDIPTDKWMQPLFSWMQKSGF